MQVDAMSAVKVPQYIRNFWCTFVHHFISVSYIQVNYLSYICYSLPSSKECLRKK